MAETIAVQPDLDSGLPISPSQKRKRGSEPLSPDSRRIKRGAPAAAMSSDDAATAAFIENAVDVAHAAAAATQINAADFSALQQAAADHNDAADPANASSTAAAALGSMYPTLHVPPTTEETFTSHIGEEQAHHDTTFASADMNHADGLRLDSANPGIQSPNGLPPDQQFSTTTNPKPAVGSEEWHKMRKDNHKEVERRRRETINEGINELAKIVPGCEKNKGSILQRAVAFITQLKENETQNIEKWTLEKLLTEQAIAELSASNDKYKQEVERLYRELETWKQVAQNAGLQPGQQKEEPNVSS